jgi:hypothetical protein
MSEGLDTIATAIPICPHCGYGDEDWWDGRGRMSDGDQYQKTCGKCGKDFSVLYEIQIYFTTEPVDKMKISEIDS